MSEPSYNVQQPRTSLSAIIISVTPGTNLTSVPMASSGSMASSTPIASSVPMATSVPSAPNVQKDNEASYGHMPVQTIQFSAV